MLQYHVPSTTMKLSKVFELIENHLDELQIEDYSVSQTTLDNVRTTGGGRRKRGLGGRERGRERERGSNGGGRSRGRRLG